MSDIALYNLLKRIPDATNDEVERAVVNVVSSKEIATKDYIDAVIAKQDARLTWRMVIIGLAIIGIIKYL